MLQSRCLEKGWTSEILDEKWKYTQSADTNKERKSQQGKTKALYYCILSQVLFWTEAQCDVQWFHEGRLPFQQGQESAGCQSKSSTSSIILVVVCGLDLISKVHEGRLLF